MPKARVVELEGDHASHIESIDDFITELELSRRSAIRAADDGPNEKRPFSLVSPSLATRIARKRNEKGLAMATQISVRPTTKTSSVDYSWLGAVASVVLAVVLCSLFAPDMVTGSNQEHLPMAAFTDWLWGAVAIGYLSFVRGGRSDLTFGLSVGMLWGAVTLTSIFAPEFVTGTDPTTIPIAALLPRSSGPSSPASWRCTQPPGTS